VAFESTTVNAPFREIKKQKSAGSQLKAGQNRKIFWNMRSAKDGKIVHQSKMKAVKKSSWFHLTKIW
jgi:hypothetical protein